MSLLKLSFSNFRRSVREYGVLVLSLAFSVFIFFNFQNVIYSDALDVLRSMRKEMIDAVVQAASVVFGVFLLFFTWYATNVFLGQRKKEIGIYIFMGLDNARIGKMYAIETFLTGAAAWIAGLAAGVGFSKLFQMILLKMSEISVDIRFSFSLTPVLVTTAVFWLIYGFMIIKGYVSIVRSSVLALLTGARKKEKETKSGAVSAVKTVLGVIALAAGYWCALETGEISSFLYAVAAVVLVIAGIYLAYDGVIPFAVRKMCENKKFLYKKERTLWVNSLSFRIRKNYRMYAMVTVLMTASVTVLGAAIALNQRYDRIVRFQETYSYQVVSYGPELDREEIVRGIEENGANEVEYSSEARVLILPNEVFHAEKYANAAYGVVSESQIKAVAEETGLEWNHPDLEKGQVIDLDHVILMSMATDNTEVTIGDAAYEIAGKDETAYLGDVQWSMSFYVLRDEDYEKYRPDGAEMLLYNFKVKDIDASADYIRSLAQQTEDGAYIVGTNIIYPEKGEDAYIRVTYSLCVFLFVTLILAAGSIIFLKVGNDAAEDRQRYVILKKIGIPEKTLQKSAKQEIRFTYYCPFVFMTVSSVFAIRALGNVMREDLWKVNVVSTLFILAVFTVIYLISLTGYRNKAIGKEK
ncbi:ABC transporter permease [Lachnoclostridium sp. An169]|uniref:ABC transporter permease n=1 Tax=Lachnoclostridium sp. An169 TaxID=1965569 RepID=UPI000B3A3408|nr:FtsX-like permease family protein [Lachnoclostridium sp. An169]OUP85162.1 ABC transporter permease [Lachnoclostridium sp. An169]